LRSIPLAPGEENEIITTLGVGEIQAQLSALGPSVITETRFSGVWLVTHYNSNDEIIGRFIEVCAMPRLLLAQEEDIRDGLEALHELLGTGD
ncbi:MAG: hydrogenase expression/formation C-terminal domain-containing protein, partial [Gammaproteobacteria bacterium]